MQVVLPPFHNRLDDSIRDSNDSSSNNGELVQGETDPSEVDMPRDLIFLG